MFFGSKPTNSQLKVKWDFSILRKFSLIFRFSQNRAKVVPIDASRYAEQEYVWNISETRSKLEKTLKKTICPNTWLQILDSHFYEEKIGQLFFNAFPLNVEGFGVSFESWIFSKYRRNSLFDAVDDFKFCILDSQIFDKKMTLSFFNAFPLRIG